MWKLGHFSDGPMKDDAILDTSVCPQIPPPHCSSCSPFSPPGWSTSLPVPDPQSPASPSPCSPCSYESPLHPAGSLIVSYMVHTWALLSPVTWLRRASKAGGWVTGTVDHVTSCTGPPITCRSRHHSVSLASILVGIFNQVRFQAFIMNDLFCFSRLLVWEALKVCQSS